MQKLLYPPGSAPGSRFLGDRVGPLPHLRRHREARAPWRSSRWRSLSAMRYASQARPSQSEPLAWRFVYHPGSTTTPRRNEARRTRTRAAEKCCPSPNPRLLTPENPVKLGTALGTSSAQCEGGAAQIGCATFATKSRRYNLRSYRATGFRTPSATELAFGVDHR